VIRSRRIRCARDVACVGEMKNVYKSFVGKPEGKRLLGRWENNTEMYLREMGLGCGVDLSGSGQGLVAGSCEHGNECLDSIKDGEFLG
jgi:hypothetical protein